MRSMEVVGNGFGVALGGGTARAYAHVGALEALEAHGWRPSAIAGTSAGAVVGAMLALGGSAAGVAAALRRLDVAQLWRQALDPALDEASLIRGRRLEAWLDRTVLGGATFADLTIPFAVACTDLRTGASIVVREGPVARAVVASCALPGLFAPVWAGTHALVDGGFVESVPFAALASLGPGLHLGLHAGIDVDRSTFVRVVRRAHATRPGRAWGRYCAGRSGADAWSRLARGLALAAASYERAVSVPPGGWLLATRPPIGWWDFHRSFEGMRAGARAVEDALAEGGLARWLRLDELRATRSPAA